MLQDLPWAFGVGVVVTAVSTQTDWIGQLLGLGLSIGFMVYIGLCTPTIAQPPNGLRKSRCVGALASPKAMRKHRRKAKSKANSVCIVAPTAKPTTCTPVADYHPFSYDDRGEWVVVKHRTTRHGASKLSL